MEDLERHYALPHARTTITMRQKRKTKTLILLMPCMKRRLMFGSGALNMVAGFR